MSSATPFAPPPWASVVVPEFIIKADVPGFAPVYAKSGAEAKAEGERLARMNPGVSFVIYKPITKAKLASPPVEFTNF